MNDTPSVWILDTLEPHWEATALRDDLLKKGLACQIVQWNALEPGRFQHADPDDRALPTLALVRSRVVTRHREGDLALLYDWFDLLEYRGVRLVNTNRALRITENKVGQALRLTDAGVPVPETKTVRSVADIENVLATWSDVIIKPIYGHASVDVTRLRNSNPAGEYSLPVRESILAWHLLDRHKILCAQRFVANPGRDLRILVIGGVIVGCYYHIATSPDGTVRDTLHPFRWGAAELTDEVAHIVRKAVDTLGLDLASIDIVEGAGGPVVIEVNPSISRWQSIERGEHDLTPEGITSAHGDYLIDLISRAATR